MRVRVCVRVRLRLRLRLRLRARVRIRIRVRIYVCVSPGSASEWRRRRGVSDDGGSCAVRGRPELSDAIVLEDVGAPKMKSSHLACFTCFALLALLARVTCFALSRCCPGCPAVLPAVVPLLPVIRDRGDGVGSCCWNSQCMHASSRL